MTEIIPGSFISISQNNVNTSKSSVQQLVDIVQVDIASVDSENTRKSYEVFTSGGVDLNSITSSLYQTVYDQDFTLGTANPLFDVSVGSLVEDVTVSNTIRPEVNTFQGTYDAGGKITGFSNTTAMVREKANIYKQFAQNLLGDSDSAFFTPHSAIAEEALAGDNSNAGTRAKKIRGAVFLCFRRLFTRDNIFKGSFGVKLHKKASLLFSDFRQTGDSNRATGESITNISRQADDNSGDSNTAYVGDDRLSETNLTISPVAGEVSTLLDDTGNHIGLIYYDSGIIILDAERVFDPEQTIRGLIDNTTVTPAASVDNTGPFMVYGYQSNQATGDSLFYYPVYTATSADHSSSYTNFVPVNSSNVAQTAVDLFYDSNVQSGSTKPSTSYPMLVSGSSGFLANNTGFYSGSTIDESAGKRLFNGKLYPDFWVSGTIDTVVDHICETRFGRGNLSAISFRNETVINSSLIFCRAAPNQLNYSTNPTYTDNDGNIIVTGSSVNNEPFSYVTTVGLYDQQGSLLAVAKTSRPIEKNPETDLSIRIRLDY